MGPNAPKHNRREGDPIGGGLPGESQAKSLPSGAGSSTERRFSGIGAVPGIATGPAYTFLKREVSVVARRVAPEKREEEIARFEQGLLNTRRQITLLRSEIEEKLGEEEAAIFDAHLLVLEDRALIEETIKEVVEGGFGIEYSFKKVADRYIDAFLKIDDEYIKERVSDIRDVTRRLLYTLMGKTDTIHHEALKGAILVADDITPSDTAKIGVGQVRGLATDYGSLTSHSVIVARSLNIPCVVGVHGLSAALVPDDQLLLDGYAGEVIVNPTEATIQRIEGRYALRQGLERRFEAEQQAEPVTADGHGFHLALNVDGSEPRELFQTAGARGVGLFRTESLFLGTATFPDEEHQYAAYARIVEASAPHPVTIRTLDLGGDKNPVVALTQHKEDNPFMGYRAIRFCLEHEAVFLTQLRAILRASALGPVKIMYPMVATLEELARADACLKEAKAQLWQEGLPFDPEIAVGCMIEVPSAALIVDLMAESMAFFSVGTNDLIQYMMAVDRVNDRVAHLYQPNHPAILRVLHQIVESAHRAGRPVSVCGEMAGEANYAPLLLGLGFDELSVAWSRVGEVKYVLRQMTLRDAQQLAQEVLHCSDASRTLSLLSAFSEKLLGVNDSAA